MPADFKHEIDKNYDGQFYITSFDGAIIKLYPMQEWELVEQKVMNGPNSNEVVEHFSDVTSYYGQTVAMDNQGRLTIAERLRKKFRLKNDLEVLVIGKLNHLEIRIEEEFSQEVEQNPLTREERNEILRTRN